MNDSEAEDLKQLISSHMGYLKEVENKVVEGSASTDDIDLIESILSYELTRVGFDENDDPNNVGLRIENLIDKVIRSRL